MGSTDKDVANAEAKNVSPRELKLRALDAVVWWLDWGRHERDEANGVWMARYIRATDWQPINTMPIDGTRVLVTNGREVEIRSQRTGRYAAPSRDGHPVNGHGISWDHWPRPTHWMPLPIPPQRLCLRKQKNEV